MPNKTLQGGNLTGVAKTLKMLRKQKAKKSKERKPMSAEQRKKYNDKRRKKYCEDTKMVAKAGTKTALKKVLASKGRKMTKALEKMVCQKKKTREGKKSKCGVKRCVKPKTAKAPKSKAKATTATKGKKSKPALKYRYPKNYMTKDGKIKKNMRKKAAEWRKNHPKK